MCNMGMESEQQDMCVKQSRQPINIYIYIYIYIVVVRFCNLIHVIHSELHELVYKRIVSKTVTSVGMRRGSQSQSKSVESLAEKKKSIN